MENEKSTHKPTYVDRLDLHEVPQSELPPEKLDRKLSGRLNQSTDATETESTPRLARRSRAGYPVCGGISLCDCL